MYNLSMLKYQNGKIEIIVGPMFAGKTAELIKRVGRYGYAGIKVLVFKPKVDSRNSDEKIKSRSGTSIDTFTIANSSEILKIWNKDYPVVAIDEAQFFDEELINVIIFLANNNVRVIVSALDQDFEGQPFGFIPNILAIAEKVDKLTAVCMQCGSAASMSFRKSSSKEIVEIGDKEYEARCRSCHESSMTERAHEFNIKNLG